MKTKRVLIFAMLFMAAVGFTAGADGIRLLADNTPPMLGQPGSLLEVYGVIDAAGRMATNATIAGRTYAGFSQGLFNGSRFGLRGTEGLFGSFKAIYTLEGGIILPAGTLDQQGQVFGRQAWIGVSSDYGRLTFGRQYGTFSDAIGVGDVFGLNHGNASYVNKTGTNYATNDAVNAFFLQESGLRWDQSIKYDANFNGVTVGAMAMPGNIPGTIVGEFHENVMYAASIGYNSKDFPVTASAGVQVEVDIANKHHNNFGGGIKYAFDPTDNVYAFYFHSVFDSGFTQINANNSEFSTTAAERTDDIAGAAVNYYLIPSVNLIAAYYFDYAQNVSADGDHGMRNSILGVVDYYFSKDFDAYLAGSYTMFNSVLENSQNGGDAAVHAGAVVPAGYNNVFAIMMGLRFRF